MTFLTLSFGHLWTMVGQDKGLTSPWEGRILEAMSTELSEVRLSSFCSLRTFYRGYWLDGRDILRHAA